MADEEETQEAPPKKGKAPLLIGLVLALILGGGGFFAAYSGMIPGLDSKEKATAEQAVPLPRVAYVPIDPILVSLAQDEPPRHLRFRAELEVVPAEQAAVESIMPRILDVLNGYLRAVDTEILERPTSLIRMRAQMLRRVQLVAGDGRVRDLLVTEFVLN